ncbi:hypothetical protein GY45DRAFT_1359498 [Cubamyces sp. BRFM 1775]|nr:hypothetical protein GY45DRAFT_1359498 [Cubamyces sp. BRFM 1775]
MPIPEKASKTTQMGTSESSAHRTKFRGRRVHPLEFYRAGLMCTGMDADPKPYQLAITYFITLKTKQTNVRPFLSILPLLVGTITHRRYTIEVSFNARKRLVWGYPLPDKAVPLTNVSFLSSPYNDELLVPLLAGKVDPPTTTSAAVRGSSLDPRTTTQIKHILRGFLSRLEYRPPHTLPNTKLRSDVAEIVTSWNIDVNPSFMVAATETSCCVTECAYGHIPYKNQLLVASYSVLALCVDDLASADTLSQVGRWVAAREKVTDPTLEPIERITKGALRIAPGNGLYADFVRRKSGAGNAYALFNFAKGWRDSSDLNYLQLVPLMDRYMCGINLSFYKETLQGETECYVYLRAAAGENDPLTVLLEMVEETVEVVRNIRAIASADSQLAEICDKHLMGELFKTNCHSAGAYAKRRDLSSTISKLDDIVLTNYSYSKEMSGDVRKGSIGGMGAIGSSGSMQRTPMC